MVDRAYQECGYKSYQASSFIAKRTGLFEVVIRRRSEYVNELSAIVKARHGDLFDLGRCLAERGGEGARRESSQEARVIQ